MKAMTDMRRKPADDESKIGAIPGAEAGSYPYGLCISLSEVELDKLGMSEKVGVGDMIHLMGMAKVTCVSAHESEAGGKCKRVELQITHLTSENEDEEKPKATTADRVSKLYK